MFNTQQFNRIRAYRTQNINLITHTQFHTAIALMPNHK